MMLRGLWFAAGAIALIPAVAGAQAHGAPEESEIVVTAPIEGRGIESLQGVVVLARDDLVANMAGGLGETLDHTPGVGSTFYGAGASRPIIRGLGEDRVRVLQNGIGAIDASSASPDHAVTSDGLEAARIEVLRGGAALAYGGNAVGGVINVIDESIPRRAPADGFDLDLTAALSSVDEGRHGAAGASFALGSVAVRLDAAGHDTDNYRVPGFARSAPLRAAEPPAPGDAEIAGKAPNSFTELSSAGAGASLVGAWGYAGFAARRLETSYGLPPEEAGARVGGFIDLEQTRYETRGDVRIGVGPFTRLDWAAQHSDYEHTEFEDTGEAGTTFFSEGYEARLEAHNGGEDTPLNGAIGAQMSETDFAAAGDEKFIDPTNTRDWGVFAVQRWDQGGFGFEGGARYEERDLKNAPAAAPVRERAFDAASVSLGAFLRPAENWFVAATAARTERAPTAQELFAEGPHIATGAFERGDPALDIETALSGELSVRYTSGKTSLEANLYRIAFNGFIALVPTDLEFDLTTETEGPVGSSPPGDDVLPIFQFVQRDAAFTGGEVSLRQGIAEMGGWTVSVDGAIDWVRASFDEGGAIPRIPPRTVTLGAGADSALVSLRLEAVDTAAQDHIAAFETTTEGSTLLNARATFRPFGGERGVAVILDGRNLTDEDSHVHASFLKDELPRPGRNIRVVLQASF
jgi:iron complex outermembrane receptor protein